MLVKLNGITNAEDALDTAGLLWNVEQHPLMTQTGKSIDDHFAVVRQDTGSVLGVVGERYHVVQNADAFAMFDTICTARGARYEYGGMTGGGRRVFLQAKLPQKFEAQKGDVVENFLTILTSHDGSSPVRSYLTPVRLWCQNRLSISWKQRTMDFTIRHTASAQGRIAEALQIYGVAAEAFRVFEEKAKYLAFKAVDRAKVQKFLDSLVPDTGSGRVRNQREMVTRLFESGRGNNGRTAWDLYNGATEWIDGPRTSDPDKRLDSSLFGSGMMLKQKALELAIAA